MSCAVQDRVLYTTSGCRRQLRKPDTMGHFRRWLFLFATLLLMAPTGRTQNNNPAKSVRQATSPASAHKLPGSRPGTQDPSPEARRRVAKPLQRVTVDQKVGRLVFTAYH